MHIPSRLQVIGEFVERIVEAVVCETTPSAHHWPVGDAAHRQSSAAVRDDRRTGDDGEISVPPAELAKRVAMAGARGRE
jgi:hypothetical protein